MIQYKTVTGYLIFSPAPPVISGTSRLQELTVVQGQEVEFHCRVSGRPAPRVEWSRDGEWGSSRVQWCDIPQYTQDGVLVVLIWWLTFPTFLSRVLSRDGDPHVEFLEGGQVLKVKAVRLRDQGLYQCLARNNAGTQMRQFRLTVQGDICLTHPTTAAGI